MSSKQFDFVRSENIRNYRQRLKIESDPQKREMLSRLLSEELAGLLSPQLTEGDSDPADGANED